MPKANKPRTRAAKPLSSTDEDDTVAEDLMRPVWILGDIHLMESDLADYARCVRELKSGANKRPLARLLKDMEQFAFHVLEGAELHVRVATAMRKSKAVKESVQRTRKRLRELRDTT